MFEVESIRFAEESFAFRYPGEFLAIVPRLKAIAATPEFAVVFSGTRFLLPTDLPAAWAGDCPSHLVPFMVTGSAGHGDHYCFHKCQKGSGLPVVVQAWDAVVYDWVDYGAFVEWVCKQCSGNDTEPSPATG
jgi:hypothetical protein